MTAVGRSQLRRDAYRVLLTRGREGAIICLPEFMPELDETYAAWWLLGARKCGDHIPYRTTLN